MVQPTSAGLALSRSTRVKGAFTLPAHREGCLKGVLKGGERAGEEGQKGEELQGFQGSPLKGYTSSPLEGRLHWCLEGCEGGGRRGGGEGDMGRREGKPGRVTFHGLGRVTMQETLQVGRRGLPAFVALRAVASLQRPHSSCLCQTHQRCFQSLASGPWPVVADDFNGSCRRVKDSSSVSERPFCERSVLGFGRDPERLVSFLRLLQASGYLN